ncbi:MAG: restriction endonuclease subunit S [Prevotella sp.]|nr:restriction endonuclease subunit S [Prevotella sp.]
MERYSSYKDTGISWIPYVPSHWEVARMKRIFSEAKEKTIDENGALLSLSQYTGVTPKDDANKVGMFEAESTIGYNVVHVGQFVMNIMLAWNGSYAVSDYEGIISPSYCIFNFNEKCAQKYFHYLLRLPSYAGAFKTMSKGIIESRLRLYPIYFLAFKTIIPPLADQEKIVRYLDSKTSKIDAYVADKEKEIQLLQELKQKTIAEAVTKGLNPNAKMRYSDISWIGMIPEHWEMKQLRSFLSLFTEKGHGDAQLLSVTREQGVILRDKDNKEENHNFVPEDLSGYKYIEKGDFAINKMKAWQGSYAVSDYCGIVSPAYFTCKLKGVNKDFFSRAIRSKAYIPFFTQYSKGIRVDQWDLNPNALKSIPFLLPPVDEQRAIVSYIEEKCQKIDTLITELQAEINYLKEYKQRLIADVVTGQVNVQNEI